MKALTIFQPYASLTVGGPGVDELKPVENRQNWRYSYRGPLLIHAGKSRAWLETWPGPMPLRMPFGALVGQVDLIDVLPIAKIRRGFLPSHLLWLRTNIHATGPHCLILAEPARFVEPIPYCGQRGLFDVPDEAIAGALLIEPGAPIPRDETTDERG